VQGFHGNRAGRVSIRVHFNQLALFTDHPVESTAEKAAGVADEGKNSSRRVCGVCGAALPTGLGGR